MLFEVVGGCFLGLFFLALVPGVLELFFPTKDKTDTEPED